MRAWNILLFAQQQDLNWVGPVIQLVTAGGFGALVWYLIVKHIPAIDERHREERREDDKRYREERKEWLEYIDRRDKALEATAKQFMDTTIRLESFLLKDNRRTKSGERRHDAE